jgi:thiamine-monophosphate kinase
VGIAIRAPTSATAGGRTVRTDEAVDITEDELIAAIGRVLSGLGPDVRVGPGDDAAVVAQGSGELVLTTDVMVEGTHFRRGVSSPRDLGYKAIAVNVSDMAAMAASPRHALCALTLSDAVDAAWVMELFGGMRECCDEFALSIVGGNLARGSEITVAVTVTGEVAPGRAVTRDGARPGDRLVVTGELGGAAAGLRLAERGAPWSHQERAAIHRHFRPVPRVGEGHVLARHGVTSMIDLSDGLGLDLARLCAASGVGARVMTEQMPVAPAARLAEALSGGEDYELLGTMPENPSAAAAELRESFGVPLTVIGTMMDEGLVAVGSDGSETPFAAEGWDHFDEG